MLFSFLEQFLVGSFGITRALTFSMRFLVHLLSLDVYFVVSFFYFAT
jgi:hypothetical protein